MTEDPRIKKCKKLLTLLDIKEINNFEFRGKK